ncbi:hypothetical protein D7S89_05420 [Trinickia fusca]|uniref:Uncharacterized protein n=1 Tax=Trinickia fusca TaxID=2419777 RepID=A0A494XQX5_9BURK|nr:hypothetical protein D7S89_05420 [Trinickia fusca]
MHPSIEQRCSFYKNVDDVRPSPVVIRASNAHHLRTSHRRLARATALDEPRNRYSKDPTDIADLRSGQRSRAHTSDASCSWQNALIDESPPKSTGASAAYG